MSSVIKKIKNLVGGDKLQNPTPRELVEQLDRYIVGQRNAKRAIAIAIRNRWRRQQLGDEMKGEVAPKNILMIGSTGVGKTEIARRLAKLTEAPFIKVEATKYTEVGYYGRDVESMVRELVENSIGLIREKERHRVQDGAKQKAEEKLLDLLCPRPQSQFGFSATMPGINASDAPQGNPADAENESYERTRAKMKQMLQAGELENKIVEITIEQKSSPIMMGGIGVEQMDMDFQGMLEKIIPKTTVTRELAVADARKVIFDQACESLLDTEKINAAAIEHAENMGIIFLDELDKVIASDSKGADVSRQGVQRDLLPIVEGTSVQTKYGYIQTDHILFVAAGAFHKHQPSELMPELQGRFPIRVELDDLTKEDFVRILTEPQNSLTCQYMALLKTEGVDLEFTDDAIDELASYADKVNSTTQNIGARRLYTILELLLEELSFECANMKIGNVQINAEYVRQRLEKVAERRRFESIYSVVCRGHPRNGKMKRGLTMKMFTCACAVPVVASILSVAAQADDWNQWLGPDRNGQWQESGIVKSFSESGPKVLWRKEIAGGYAGPAVSDGRVYVTDYVISSGDPTPNPGKKSELNGKERVHCFDIKTGDTIWTHESECPYKLSFASGPRVTPTVDKDRVYTLGAEGNLFCFNAKNGDVIWSKDLKKSTKWNWRHIGDLRAIHWLMEIRCIAWWVAREVWL